jgi:hypothetical protein
MSDELRQLSNVLNRASQDLANARALMDAALRRLEPSSSKPWASWPTRKDPHSSERTARRPANHRSAALAPVLSRAARRPAVPGYSSATGRSLH